jgi:hypothetical protein
MPTSGQLEREARASRERLSRTIDELRMRLTPASMVDEATAYLRRAAEEPIVADAPAAPTGSSRYALPLALLGAGVAWLAVEAGRAERERARLGRFAQPVSEDAATAVTAEVPIADSDLAAIDRASARTDAVRPVRRATDTIEPLPASSPGRGRRLTAVESASIAPAPADEKGKRAQRVLP